MATDKTAGGEVRRGFATTRWSRVLAAGESSARESSAALSELCELYWYPLYAYIRRHGNDAETARDLTQSFFAKLLENQDLKVADPARGRFRTFLLSSLKNFLAGEWRKDQALKRGGDVSVIPLDFEAGEASYRIEPYHQLSPDAIYERRFAIGLLDRALGDLRQTYEDAGKAELFEGLKGCVGSGESPPSYAALAVELGQSEGALRTAASRLRSRWRDRIRELVAETVSDESEIEDELQRLIASLANGV